MSGKQQIDCELLKEQGPCVENRIEGRRAINRSLVGNSSSKEGL